jgi:hypothetical protein
VRPKRPPIVPHGEPRASGTREPAGASGGGERARRPQGAGEIACGGASPRRGAEQRRRRGARQEPAHGNRPALPGSLVRWPAPERPPVATSRTGRHGPPPPRFCAAPQALQQTRCRSRQSGVESVDAAPEPGEASASFVTKRDVYHAASGAKGPASHSQAVASHGFFGAPPSGPPAGTRASPARRERATHRGTVVAISPSPSRPRDAPPRTGRTPTEEDNR